MVSSTNRRIGLLVKIVRTSEVALLEIFEGVLPFKEVVSCNPAVVSVAGSGKLLFRCSNQVQNEEGSGMIGYYDNTIPYHVFTCGSRSTCCNFLINKILWTVLIFSENVASGHMSPQKL